jgi:hypothetical protein
LRKCYPPSSVVFQRNVPAQIHFIIGWIHSSAGPIWSKNTSPHSPLCGWQHAAHFESSDAAGTRRDDRL